MKLEWTVEAVERGVTVSRERMESEASTSLAVLADRALRSVGWIGMEIDVDHCSDYLVLRPVGRSMVMFIRPANRQAEAAHMAVTAD